MPHGHSFHADRDDLTGEYRWGDLGQIILLFLFLGIWAADSFFFRFSTFLSASVALWIRLLIAIPVFVIGSLMVRSGLAIVFGEVRETPAVIRKGVFGRVRRPIYVAALLFYIGIWITTLSLATAAVLLIGFIFYAFISRHEENLLLARFGDEYTAYMSEVPMWIPRFKRKKH